MNPTITSPRATRAALFGAASLGLAFAILVAYRFAYAERIYPGVYVADVYVGGASPSDALDLLAGSVLDPSAPVVVTAGEDRWEISPADAGVLFDARATIEQAYGIGRQGRVSGGVISALAARFAGTSVRPVVSVDQGELASTLSGFAATYDRPAENAGFEVEGTDLLVTDAVPGRALNVSSGLERTLSAAESGAWPISVDIPVQEIAPAIAEAGAAYQQAQALLSGPIVLESADAKTWDLPAADLAGMLEPRSAGAAVTLGLNEAQLAAWLAPIALEIETEPVNARLGFDTITGQFIVRKPSVPGRTIDAQATATRILAAGGAATRRIQIAEMNRSAQIADEALAADFGIMGLIREETSHFAGSPSARVHNIGIAAEMFDGILVPPDTVVSFNDSVGDITAETGYLETKIIMDGTTAQGVGGGVCQVSTTLFRLAFWAGLPIAERHAHGYRVAYYEQGDVDPGLDATIYSPVVDLKFTNDTGGWLLIETETRPRDATLTFRLYGPTLNRRVSMEGPVVGNRVAAPPGRVEVDASLAPGETETLEYSRGGADVTVVRIVDTGEGEPVRESFFSRYRPTGEVLAVGPAPDVAPPLPESAPPGYAPPGYTLP